MRHRGAGVPPVGDVAHVSEVGTRRVEIVRDKDAVQVVERATEVDDGARGRVKQDRDRERVGEGHTDGSRGLARGVLLVDLFDGYQQVLTALLN